MRLRPFPTLAAVTVVSLALFACNADSPLADGPGPLPQRDGPLTITQGNEAFNAGDYGAALEAYARADEQMPERPEPDYNSGNALYRMDSLEEAQNLYQGALVMADDDDRPRKRLCKKRLKPLATFNVQMIRRLIKKQDIWRLQKEHRQRQPGTLTT